MILLVLAALSLAEPDAKPVEPHKVFVVAGHGNGPREGNIGVLGQKEAAVALDISLRLEAALTESGMAVTLGRKKEERPSYDLRLERLAASQAPIMLEIHTDSRPEHTYSWTNAEGVEVLRNDKQPGFSVLFNEGSDLGPERRRLARAMATSLTEAGLKPYTQGYGEFYDADTVPGVYIDRRGLKMLRAPEVPSVIIETHHALDPVEAAAWTKQATHDRFAEGVRGGLDRWFTPATE